MFLNAPVVELCELVYGPDGESGDVLPRQQTVRQVVECDVQAARLACAVRGGVALCCSVELLSDPQCDHRRAFGAVSCHRR